MKRGDRVKLKPAWARTSGIDGRVARARGSITTLEFYPLGGQTLAYIAWDRNDRDLPAAVDIDNLEVA